MAFLKMVFFSFEGQMIFALWNGAFHHNPGGNICYINKRQTYINCTISMIPLMEFPSAAG